jgi:hypothetical protein
MDHASPFQTSTFQELSNDISKSSINWVLTLEIALWRFGSLSGLQLPKWKLPWECEGSFPHTLLHSRAPLSTRNLASPCLGREPKSRVATIYYKHNIHSLLWWLERWCWKNMNLFVQTMELNILSNGSKIISNLHHAWQCILPMSTMKEVCPCQIYGLITYASKKTTNYRMGEAQSSV